MTDPLKLIRQLNVETIRSRLEALDRERAALMVLLRAARRAQQGCNQTHPSNLTATARRKEVRP